MFRTHVKFLTVAVVLALLLSAASVSEACGWGCGWGWRTMGWGGWSCGASACDPCGGWGWGCHRWGGYGLRGCGLRGCGWGAWTGWGLGCCGAAVAEPCCGGVSVGSELGVPVVPGAPAGPAPTLAPPATTPVPPAPAPVAPKATEIRSDSGLLSLWVPEDATVFVNGYQTKSTGNHRQYISNGLKPGLSYTYEVRVVVVRDGKPLEETRTVNLVGGQRSALAFSFSAPAGLASIW